MKPEQFIREFGEKKARELLNADSDFKTYCLIDKSFWGESEGTCGFCVDLDGVKRLVESLDLIEELGGMKVIKKHLRGGGVLGGRVVIAVKDHESIYGGGHV
ncbi:hypothetical protein NQ784_03710 [Acinetobacter baumannii]|nr:hypothetical protein [Acinetobacter baumannii]